jgi:hypothetical protein
MEESQAIMELGQAIDAALNSETATLAAIYRAEGMTTTTTDPVDVALLAYFQSNAWANLHELRTTDRNRSWAWEQPDLQKRILLLRTALLSAGFSGMELTRRCQVHTNLGNALNTLGRVVEAIEQWDHAIGLNPSFGMALGNRANGLETYARGNYDNGHKWLLWLNAIDAYDAALAPNVYFDSPGRDQMAKARERAAAVAPVEAVRQGYAPNGHSLGRSKAEQAYRSWALQHRLFLHPLNDVGPISLAARDVLSQPTFVTLINEPPTLIGFFNQLKQEYVSARWFVYSGLLAERPHFSDRDVLLQDTLDYPVYCLNLEQIKIGYRLAYSLFDKVAFFINHYWQLNCPARRVNFRTIWYKENNFEKGLHPTFLNAPENLFLRGLYWIAKDIFDDRMRETAEPVARDLDSIRNHLEHKYLKVTDDQFGLGERATPLGQDTLAHILNRADLEAKTLKILKLTRCVLIHLSLAMHAEEQRRHPESDRLVPMELPTVLHRFKR